MEGMDENPYVAPQHYAERPKLFLEIRSRKFVVGFLALSGCLLLGSAYADQDIANAVFGLVDFAIAGLIISGCWPKAAPLRIP